MTNNGILSKSYHEKLSPMWSMNSLIMFEKFSFLISVIEIRPMKIRVIRTVLITLFFSRYTTHFDESLYACFRGNIEEGRDDVFF